MNTAQKRGKAREKRRRHYRRTAAGGFLMAIFLEARFVALDPGAWADWAGMGISLVVLATLGVYALLDMNDTRIARLEKELAEVQAEIARLERA